MNKFDLVTDQAGMPERLNALPELNYPDRVNATARIVAEAQANGWLDRTAYYSRGEATSYRALIDGTARMAGALKEAGVEPEHRVLLRMVDSPAQVMALLALFGLGAIAVPTFTQLRADDLAYRATDSGAKLMLVEPELLEEAAAAYDAGCGLEQLVVVGDDPGGRFTTLEALAKGAAPVEGWADTDADDLALILYTSGTTGRPKGAAHSQRDLLAAGDTFSRYVLGTTEDDVFAGPPALPFAMGIAFLALYSLRFGAAAVLCPEKTVEAFVTAFAEHEPTIFISVPTFYHRMLDHFRAGGALPLDSFRTLLCAGEPLYAEFEHAWNEETGVQLAQIIGTTEMLHAFAGYRPGLEPLRTETIGRASAGYEITVRDPETLEEVPRGEQGLMCVRGPTACVYWSPREVQTQAVRDGWAVVQDLISMDDAGFIHFVSRQDEMIVSGGMNISPVDVERVVLQHPAVAECAVVPSPDESGQRSAVVKAFVVAADGHAHGDALAADIQAFFKKNGPPFMYPRKVEFLEALPKSLTGKIQRSALKRREMGD